MATLEYDFRVVGLDAISKAFASLERRAKTHNDKMTRMFADANIAPGAPSGRRGRGGPVAGGAGGAATRGRDPLEQQRRDNVKRRNQQQKDDARALNEGTKQHNTWLRLRAKWHQEEINQETKKENEKTKATKKAAKERERILQVQSTQRQQARRAVVGGVAGAISSLGQKAVAGATVGAGAYIAAGINAGRSAYREATALTVQAKQGGNVGSLKDINKSILDTSARVTQATGIERAQVVRQMSAFYGPSGNLDAAKNLSKYMTMYAEAADASPEDVGTLAGQAYATSARKGMSPAEAEENVKHMLGMMMTHAAKYSINVKDYVGVGPELFAAASRTGSSDMFAKAFGLTSFLAQQSPGGGAVSAPEAATATSRLVDALTEHAPKIKQLTGVETMFVDPKTGIKRLKSFEETLPALFAATNADPQMLNKMGIDVRANRAFQGLTDIYAVGKQRLGPGTDQEKGAEALREAMKKSFSEVTTPAQIEEMAAFRKEEDPYARLEAALTKLADNAIPPLTEAMASFTNWLEKNKGTVETVATTATDAAKFAGEHPVATGGIIVGGVLAAKAAAAYVAGYFGAAGATAAGGAAATGGAAVAGGTAATGGAAVAGGAAGIGAGPVLLGAATLGMAGFGTYKGYEFAQQHRTGNKLADALLTGTAMNIGTLLGPFLTARAGVDAIGGAPSPVGAGTGGPIGAPQAEQAQQADPSDVLKAAASTAFVPASNALINAAMALNNAAGSLTNRGDAPGQPAASAGGRK